MQAKDIIKLSATASSIAALFLCFFAFCISGDILLSIYFSVVLSLIVFVYLIFSETSGRKRHANFIKNKGFKELISSGFEIEEKNNYRGITGVFEGYIFDIYFDWYTTQSSSKGVIFNAYFMSMMLKDGKLDIRKLKFIREKYTSSIWSLKVQKLYWRNRYVRFERAFIFKPSAKQYWKTMRIIVDILKSEGLQPVDRKTLEDWRKINPHNNIPEIETYIEEP